MLRTMLAVTIATGACVIALGAHAQAPKYPEYQRTWEDGALRTNAQKGFKGKAPRQGSSGARSSKRQYNPAMVVKPVDK